MLSQTEENYLKAIYKLYEKDNSAVSTNSISKSMHTSAASVTDMIKRLSKKSLIHYIKHRGVTLTEKGNTISTNLVRRHRLWEVFLTDKLNFKWDEVHDIAEQLEHIQSDELILRLEEYLGHPRFDPHGDPIPDVDGNFAFRKQFPLNELAVGEKGILVGVQEHSTQFLQFLDQIKLKLGVEIEVLKKFDYDDSVIIKLQETAHTLSLKVSKNLFFQIKN